MKLEATNVIAVGIALLGSLGAGALDNPLLAVGGMLCPIVLLSLPTDTGRSLALRCLQACLAVTVSLFAMQVIADVDHVSAQNAELSRLGRQAASWRQMRDLQRQMDEINSAGADDIYQIGSRLRSQEIDRYHSEVNSFVKKVHQQELEFSRLRTAMDYAWLLFLLVASLAVLKQWNPWRTYAGAVPVVVLLAAIGTGAAALASGSSGSSMNLAVWPLGVANFFLQRHVTSFGDTIEWPYIFMLLWGSLTLGLALASCRNR